MNHPKLDFRKETYASISERKGGIAMDRRRMRVFHVSDCSIYRIREQRITHPNVDREENILSSKDGRTRSSGTE